MKGHERKACVWQWNRFGRLGFDPENQESSGNNYPKRKAKEMQIYIFEDNTSMKD